jgi:hypothetical protein
MFAPRSCDNAKGCIFDYEILVIVRFFSHFCEMLSNFLSITLHQPLIMQKAVYIVIVYLIVGSLVPMFGG